MLCLVVRDQKPEARSKKPEVRDQRPETRNKREEMGTRNKGAILSLVSERTDRSNLMPGI
ncbi:MAG: hypothetical protein QME63_06065 [Actinomycetota bacterium]|nr:hypothetical protein [Actinomycetota bacterium]